MRLVTTGLILLLSAPLAQAGTGEGKTDKGYDTGGGGGRSAPAASDQPQAEGAPASRASAQRRPAVPQAQATRALVNPLRRVRGVWDLSELTLEAAGYADLNDPTFLPRPVIQTTDALVDDLLRTAADGNARLVEILNVERTQSLEENRDARLGPDVAAEAKPLFNAGYGLVPDAAQQTAMQAINTAFDVALDSMIASGGNALPTAQQVLALMTPQDRAVLDGYVAENRSAVIDAAADLQRKKLLVRNRDVAERCARSTSFLSDDESESSDDSSLGGLAGSFESEDDGSGSSFYAPEEIYRDSPAGSLSDSDAARSDDGTASDDEDEDDDPDADIDDRLRDRR